MASMFARTWDGPWNLPAHPDTDFAALLGPSAWRRLHPDIRRRFARPCGAAGVVYDGCLTLRRSRAGAVFAVVCRALGGPLPFRQCEGAYAVVHVRGDGRGGIMWERWIRFPGRARAAVIRSTKRVGHDGRLLECIEGGLGMVLAVFESGGALVFESRGYFLAVLGVRLPLPPLFTPGRCRVEHRVAGPGRFDFAFSMDHPLLGRTFSQSGNFHDPESPP